MVEIHQLKDRDYQMDWVKKKKKDPTVCCKQSSQ